MSKTLYLRNIEKNVMDQTGNHDVSVQEGKPKFFITFPYPYMNGKLHWGHAFTLLKADFEARFKSINGFNVLFPFGFHCTGIPIHAAAKRLEAELSVNGKTEKPQYNILLGSGISESEIPKFTDPYHWIRTFPEMGRADLKKLGVMVDHRRSFVTTDANPFYDSFIRWQFNKLRQKGYLKFGTRNSIYSEALGMQCQDHDRSVGEGIQNVDYHIMSIPYSYKDQAANIWICSICPEQKISLVRGAKYNCYRIANDITLTITTDYVMRNWIAQNPQTVVEIVEERFELDESCINIKADWVDHYINKYNELLGSEVCTSETGEVNDETLIEKPLNLETSANYVRNLKSRSDQGDLPMKVSLTSDLVVDRMGKMCIVKPVPQWYIDYALPEWKAIAISAVQKMKCSDGIKTALIGGINWLKEWACLALSV